MKNQDYLLYTLCTVHTWSCWQRDEFFSISFDDEMEKWVVMVKWKLFEFIQLERKSTELF